MFTTLSQDQSVLIKKTLQEDEERFHHFLGLLQKWMDCHHFIPRNYNQQMLPIFLRHSKYNLDKTKRRLELYFVYKKRFPEAFSFHELTDTEQRALDNFYIFESTKLTPEGYRVGCAGFRSPDTTGCDMNVVNIVLAMLSTYRANLDCINGGIVFVANFQNLSPSIVSGIMNPFFKRLLDMVQKVHPFRVRGVYVTHLPGFAVPITNMIKMVFREKIRSRIYLEADDKQLKKNVPLDCLPKEYGGTDGTINENAATFFQEIMQAKPWFLEQEKIQMVGDIPKDLYEVSGIDENFGTQGSFRNLKID